MDRGRYRRLSWALACWHTAPPCHGTTSSHRPAAQRCRAVGVEITEDSFVISTQKSQGHVELCIPVHTDLARYITNCPKDGPAFIESEQTTAVIYPGHTARTDAEGNLSIAVPQPQPGAAPGGPCGPQP